MHHICCKSKLVNIASYIGLKCCRCTTFWQCRSFSTNTDKCSKCGQLKQCSVIWQSGLVCSPFPDLCICNIITKIANKRWWLPKFISRQILLFLGRFYPFQADFTLSRQILPFLGRFYPFQADFTPYGCCLRG